MTLQPLNSLGYGESTVILSGSPLEQQLISCEMDMSVKCKLKSTSDTDFAFIERRGKESEPLKWMPRMKYMRRPERHDQTCVLIII